MKSAGKYGKKTEHGAALLEFVLCFPILFVLFLFAVQFAYIMITWQVVHYSAYMGARSAMTVNNIQRKSRAENVVKRILAVVSASPADSREAADRADDKYIRLDGWGRLPNTKYLDQQVDVDIPLLDIDPRGVKCTVKFKMFLQPKVDLQTGAVGGAEALVRWVPDTGNMIRPDQFIPVFEKNGFCSSLDMYMAEHIITWFYATCKIFFVIVTALFIVLQVPLSYLFSHFWIKVSFVVEEVQSFIHIYNDMEQKLDTASRRECCRYHRYSEKLT